MSKTSITRGTTYEGKQMSGPTSDLGDKDLWFVLVHLVDKGPPTKGNVRECKSVSLSDTQQVRVVLVVLLL
jgi:hypothetical protein